jgi:hypothetical protein
VDALLVTTLNATDFMVFDEWALILTVFRRTRWIKDVSIMRVTGDQDTISNSGFAFMEILVSGWALAARSIRDAATD